MNQRVLRAVDVELTAAAAERWVVPVEGFLWRARRCAEAMLYALLVEAGVDVIQLAAKGKGLNDLASHLKLQGVIPRAMRDHLESVQKFGNTATHFQPEGPVSEASATGIASMLAELARWFYTRDGRSLPDAVQGPLAALTDERRRLRSPAELALEQEQRRAHQLTQQLRAATTPSIERPPPPFTARLAAIGVGLAATGGALGFGAGWLSHAPEAPAPVPVPTVIASPSPTVPPAPAVATTPLTPTIAEPTPAPVPVASDGMRACPAAMRLVGARGEPGAFCIDQDAVLEGAYRQCVARGRCAHPPPAPEPGCNWENGLNELSANCLPWSFARAYCQQRPEPGDLPTRVEWQAVAANRVAVRLVADTHEWSSDPAIGAMRPVRGARRGAAFAWSAEPEARGHRNVSFRCVLRASTP